MDCGAPPPPHSQGEGTRGHGGYSPGRAVHRSPPASLGYRHRSRQRGCRLPHWHRHKSHCSSGPTSHWDMAGNSPGPATLGRGPKVSPSHAQHDFLPASPAPQAASRSPQLPRPPFLAQGSPHLCCLEMGPLDQGTGLWGVLPPPRPWVGFSGTSPF